MYQGKIEGSELPKNITIASDFWCPYVCDLKSKEPGYLVEVSKIAFANLGVRPVFHALGWQKSIELAENGHVNGIIAAGKTNHGKTLLSSELLGIDQTVIITRKAQKFEDEQILKSMDSLILGVIVDYTYDFNGPLDDYIVKRKLAKDRIVILNHSESVKALFVMLNRNSIDAFPENIFVAQYMAKSLNIIEKVTFHPIARHDHIFMAFSPDLSGQRLREVFDAEVRLLKSSGRLGMLMLKYGIEDNVTEHQH